MTWKDDYKRAVINAIIKHGSPVSDTPSFYSWIAYDFQERAEAIREVGIDYAATSMPDDSQWDEFKGTFYEGDTRERGIDAVIYLNDGRAMRWRCTSNFSDLLKAVLEESGD